MSIRLFSYCIIPQSIFSRGVFSLQKDDSTPREDTATRKNDRQKDVKRKEKVKFQHKKNKKTERKKEEENMSRKTTPDVCVIFIILKRGETCVCLRESYDIINGEKTIK